MNIFGFMPLMIGTPEGMRAMSQDELDNKATADYRLAINSNRNAEYILSLRNYRPPVHVPSGWEDWYAIGDDLQ